MRVWLQGVILRMASASSSRTYGPSSPDGSIHLESLHTLLRLLRADIQTLAAEIRRLGVVLDDGYNPYDSEGEEMCESEDVCTTTDDERLVSNEGINALL